MASEQLELAAADIAPLRAVVVTAMPDCLLFDSWIRGDEDWKTEEVASYFGDLVRSNRRALKSLGSWSSEMQVTIESADSLLLLRELNEHFVCGCIFERGAPLGMVRLHLNRLMERIAPTLPQVANEERPRGVRIADFLNRYAPDPHAVLLRVAVRTGLGLEQLRNPATLNDAECDRLEAAAKRILGLEQLNV